MGGAFDPVTKGHRISGEFVKSNTNIDEVWIIPCFNHLYDKKMVNPLTRLHLCEIACKKSNGLKVSDFEIKNQLSGSTYEMILKIKEEFPNNKFSLVMGLDNANTISKWHRYEELINTTRCIVLNRKGYSPIDTVNQYLKKPHIYIPETNIPETASKNVRCFLKNGNFLKAKEDLDPEVFDYILLNNLYIE